MADKKVFSTVEDRSLREHLEADLKAGNFDKRLVDAYIKISKKLRFGDEEVYMLFYSGRIGISILKILEHYKGKPWGKTKAEIKKTFERAKQSFLRFNPRQFSEKLYDPRGSLRGVMAVSLKITGKCNFRCKDCSTAFMDRKHGNTKLLLKIIDDLKGIPKINISGGEPGLHPDLQKILKRASKCADKVQLNTNAFWISAKYKQALEQLSMLPKNCEIMVAVDEFHFRASKNRRLLEKKIKNLLKGAGQLGIDVTVNCVDADNKLPKIEDRELLGLLKKEEVLFRGKPADLGAGALFPGGKVAKISRSRRIRFEKSLWNLFPMITPDGKVFASEAAHQGLITDKSPSYIGDANHESAGAILERLLRKNIRTLVKNPFGHLPSFKSDLLFLELAEKKDPRFLDWYLSSSWADSDRQEKKSHDLEKRISRRHARYLKDFGFRKIIRKGPRAK